MEALLFLNGSPPAKETLKAIDFKRFFVACADGAYDYLRDYCTPDILVGDFDSINNLDLVKDIGLKKDNSIKDSIKDLDSIRLKDNLGLLKANKIIKLSPEKDYTDGHIAMLEVIDTKPERIYIYGALGGDPDHEISNYSLLALSDDKKIQAVILSERYSVYLANGFFSCIAKEGKRVSLVPFTDEVHIISTRGLKYPITDEIFNKLHIKGISNVSVSTGFSVSSVPNCKKAVGKMKCVGENDGQRVGQYGQFAQFVRCRQRKQENGRISFNFKSGSALIFVEN